MTVDFSLPEWATHVVSDLTDMERNPYRVNPTKVSAFSLDLPDDVYFEYAFLDAAGAMRPDPGNAVKADNPWYPGISAVLGPTYAPSPYASPSVKAQGRVLRQRVESAALEQVRRVTLYTPSGHESEALPTVYVQDGTAYYRIAHLADVLETLVQEGRARPAHLAFVEPVERTLEYRFNPAYREFVCQELVPFVDLEVATTAERIAMGASLGGLVSATLALERPDLFRTVVAQSGAFLGNPDEPDFYRGKTSWVLAQLETRPKLDLRWYTDVGTIEWLTDVNRRVHDTLLERGYEHAFETRHAGHNWTNWRNGLGAALSFALDVQ